MSDPPNSGPTNVASKIVPKPRVSPLEFNQKDVKYSESLSNPLPVSVIVAACVFISPSCETCIFWLAGAVAIGELPSFSELTVTNISSEFDSP